MAKVFISYSSRHRDLTRDFAARLVAEGLTVWWDRELEAWGEYEPQINEALLAADVVVVIWSPGAVASRFVKAEVERALLSRKLVNLRAPDFPLSDVPLNYAAVDHIQTLELDDLAPVLKAIDTVRRGETLVGARQLHEHYRERFGESLFDPRRQALPKDPAMVTPSVLLQAPFEVANYADAAGVLADMLDWCHGAGTYSEINRLAAGRLLHGPGGLGKTRLMIEAVRRLRAEGWLAGFYPAAPTGDPARSDMRRLAIQQVLSHGPESGVLMVLDYAESRASDVIELARMARKRPDDAIRPFRLVLLSRGEGWWQDIYRTEPEVQVVFNKRGAPHGDVIAAAPLPEGPERLQVFDAMRAALAPIVAQQAAAGRFPPVNETALLQDKRDRLATNTAYARPLALQMEALLSLAGESGSEIAELLESVLLLERNHWRKVIVGLADDGRREMAMRRGISQVTALGGVDAKPALQRLMQRDLYFGQRAPIDMPLSELNRLYGRGQTWVAPLEPDLIGEHELLSSGDEDMLDACRAWIDGLPEPDRSPRRRILFTMLQRAARSEHGASARVAEALSRHLVAGLTEDEVPDLIAVAIETQGPLAGVIEELVPTVPFDVLAAIEASVPALTVRLAGVAEAIVTRREKDLRASEPSTNDEIAQAAFAKVLHDRARSLHMLGRWEDALVVWEEAVATGRQLISTQLDGTKPKLAKSLSNLSLTLSCLGRRDQALTAADEAVTILRHVASNRADAAEQDLAHGLDCLSISLAELGRHVDAVVASEEAVAIYRRLAVSRSTVFEPDLASSLYSLGIRLADLGRREEALAATEGSLTIYNRLAAARPDAFEPDLAKCLVNHGNSLSNLGQLEAALVATENAVAILRRLASERPDVFEPDLARGLQNLGNRFGHLGQHEMTLVATEEALMIRRRLVEAHPDAFEAEFSDNLTCYGVHLYHLGRLEAALAATDQALEIYRRLAAAHPNAYEPSLARNLNNRGCFLAAVGRSAEAIVATEEAVAIHRRLAVANPAAFQPSLASSLTDLGVDLFNLGRTVEALAATEEAVAIGRRLAAVHPETFEPRLAASLNNMSDHLLPFDRRAEAAAAAEEGIALLTPHHVRRPAAHQALMDLLTATLAKARAAANPDGATA
ncbi:toll/interleukin-1 receptor domain-containing protein [Rhizobium sp. SL86]|uniref:toll/interleukin-1 receptor domain-containing protein n=1 Tax=Rhizobium sp. SL86 TaxID=2995148 RepID=UPI002276A29C|nr:toll/interleukin-1 receptor domain-containing protein [Rhizobium sp. SL86]MCY1669024.1 toll/interleukin-1 receptor domain-containing protein [Rhizobium sp. SL86]